MKPAIKSDARLTRDLHNWWDDFWSPEGFYRDDFFRFRNGNVPAVNIMEEDDSFTIELAAPGLSKEDFNVEVDKNLLKISAESSESSEEKEDAYTRREFNFSSFSRTFTLPENADPSKISAKYAEGVLKIKMKRREVTKPESMKINIG